MSGFAAIVRFDGQPVDDAALRRMTAAMAFRGSDGIGQEVRRAFGLGHCAFHTTAEASDACMPLSSEQSGLWIVMDGYLANPDELRDDLVARGARLRNRSDAEMVLHAFEIWGAQCVAHLEGEFAFVICDERQGKAFCAKDHAGLRPLHYHWDGKRLVVASDIAGVLAAGDFEQRLDADAMAEQLASEFYTIDTTVWSGVMRLPFASAMTVDERGPSVSRYWTPLDSPVIRHARDEDYFEHYRDVFMDSVRRSSRSQVPLGCEVSGGHDSSAIFAMAWRLREKGRLPAPDLAGFTLAGEPGDASDETAYARDVGRFFGTTIIEAPRACGERAWFAQQMARDRTMTIFPNRQSGVAEYEAARRAGCRVLLEGEGGDEFLGGTGFYLHDLLRARNFAGLGEELGPVWRKSGIRGVWPQLYHYGLRPFAPLFVDRIAESLRKARFVRPPHLGHGPHWATRPVRDRLKRLRHAALQRDDSWKVRDPSRRRMWREMQYPFYEQIRDVSARYAAQNMLELRTPMYGRRFIEFVYGIPDTLRLRRGEAKFIHLRALSHDLPQSILKRRSKADFGLAFQTQLASMDKVFLEDIPGFAPEAICAEGLRSIWQNYQDKAVGHWELWQVYVWYLLLQQEQQAT